jgi:hypothetical protein
MVLVSPWVELGTELGGALPPYARTSCLRMPSSRESRVCYAVILSRALGLMVGSRASIFVCVHPPQVSIWLSLIRSIRPLQEMRDTTVFVLPGGMRGEDLNEEFESG